MTTGKKIVYAFLAAMVPLLLYAYSSGPDPRYTAAPGDSPLACATSGCHTGLPQGGPINAAGGSVSATFSSGNTYMPGQLVVVTVNVSDPVNALHGFQMTARLERSLSTAQAGRFTYNPGTGVFVLCDNNVPRTRTGDCPAGFPVEFIEHNAPSTGTFTFGWRAPSANQGPVHFYVAGNAVNGDATNGPQDHVYTASYVLQPAACIQSLPVITKVQSARGFGGYNFFTSGSYLEITGSNLAGVTRQWLTRLRRCQRTHQPGGHFRFHRRQACLSLLYQPDADQRAGARRYRHRSGGNHRDQLRGNQRSRDVEPSVHCGRPFSAAGRPESLLYGQRKAVPCSDVRTTGALRRESELRRAWPVPAGQARRFDLVVRDRLRRHDYSRRDRHGAGKGAGADYCEVRPDNGQRDQRRTVSNVRRAVLLRSYRSGCCGWGLSDQHDSRGAAVAAAV